ncbi:hypothetical protein E4T43_00061 [Aureobasidium subglaciale]|nr:hypothetical protein E4T43_00061 [Aureobasidium subglaciale]
MHLSTLSITVAAVMVDTALGLPQGCLSSVTVNGTCVCSMPKSISPIIGKVNANASWTTTATYYTPSHEEVLSALGHTSPTSSDDQVISKMTPSPESSAISIAGVVTDLHNYYDHMEPVISTTYRTRTIIIKHISGPTYHTTISGEWPAKSESKLTSSTKSKSKTISSTKSKSTKSSLLSERTSTAGTPIAAAAVTSSKATKKPLYFTVAVSDRCKTYTITAYPTLTVDCKGRELKVKTQSRPYCKAKHVWKHKGTSTKWSMECMETSSPVMDF